MTELSGHDVQYVRRLACQDKIGAVKNGRDWWIDVEMFTTYLTWDWDEPYAALAEELGLPARTPAQAYVYLDTHWRRWNLGLAV